VRIHKLGAAFVAIDLEAEVSTGPVRWARRILHGGAQDLARSQTYTYAVLGMQRSGASAGISAEATDRAAALAAFVDAARALVAERTFLPDAAKGVSYADLDGLRGSDPRNVARLDAFAAGCEGLGAAVAADATVGLDGRSVAIEGFAESGPALAAAIDERGGRVVAVATPSGAVANPEGFDPAGLAEAWAEHGASMVRELGEPGAALDLFAAGAEVVFAGSKMGIVDHGIAEQLKGCAAVVACGRLPVTARALAVLRRAEVAVVADFVSLAGSTIAAWSDESASDEEVHAQVAEQVAGLSAEFAAHDQGPLLAGCYAAESFLSTWQDELPFGRPLAA